MKTIFFILLMLSSPILIAQRLSVIDFRTDSNDLSALSDMRMDVKGNICAIIKVRTNITGLRFDSRLGISEVRTFQSEYWLYVSPNERKIKFILADKKFLNYIFPHRIESSSVYILELAHTNSLMEVFPVTIRITPSDAKLIINGKQVANAASHQLAVGENTIRIEKTGYHAIEKVINVNKKHTFFEFVLQHPRYASLQITSSPSGVKVFLDGIDIGTTPISLFYKPGSYKLQLVKEGYVTIENEILEVKLLKTFKSYTMKENVGYITINTHSGAKVFINDQRINTPKNVKLSPQLLRIKVSMPKTKDLEQQIELRRNDRLTIDMFPDVQTATLQIAVTPFDAKIELTGDASEKYSADTMKIFENVPVGTYTLTVSACGYKTKQESLTIGNVEWLSKTITLNTLEFIEEVALQTKQDTSISTAFENVCNPKTGKVWMDRNLGASRVAQSRNDEEAFGDLYQWGRATDGHEKRSSETSNKVISQDTPAHGNFIKKRKWSPFIWTKRSYRNLWQGVHGTNNPCPPGYRIPTDAEWEVERRSWSSNNAAGAFNSPLRLPSGGFRSHIKGALTLVGSDGYYWSSTVDGSLSQHLLFFSSSAYMESSYHTNGFSVRCIKD